MNMAGRILFFFSSRRRHTSCGRDWSSDVCSSDLRFDSLEDERERLLNEDKVLYRQPWIELLPEYKSSGKTINDLSAEDLPGLNEEQQNTFKGLVSQGLIPD